MNFAYSRELVIVGGGPAGMAAALEARSAGVDVLLVDERPTLGGQIYRQFPQAFEVVAPAAIARDLTTGRRLIEDVEASGADLWFDSSVWDLNSKRLAIIRDGRDSGTVEARAIVLSTGAYDRPVPFPGWTLPGVLSAGGAHALVKTQGVLPGEKIVMVGSGPLVLSFAAQLAHLGANVVAVFEAAQRPGIGAAWRLLRAAHGNLGLILSGLRFVAELREHRIPLVFGHTILRVEGVQSVERAVVGRVGPDWRPIPGTERVLEVDTVCVGYGFFSSTELSSLAGCEHDYDENLGGPLPVRDEWMRTTVAGIYAAGDGAGVAGSDVAIQEGRLAGIGAAFDLGHLSAAQAAERAQMPKLRLASLSRFRAALNSVYSIGAGIYELADSDTIVCRCEEVTVADLLSHIRAGSSDVNALKALTRAGMGNCQGRNCQRQVAALIGKAVGRRVSDVGRFTARAPIKPLPVGLVAQELSVHEPPQLVTPTADRRLKN